MKKSYIYNLLNLNCNEQHNRQQLDMVLHKIKPFAKEEKVPIEKMEKLIGLICRKYDVSIKEIYISYIPHNTDIYKVTVLIGLSKPKIIYGGSMYELFAKLCIYLYDLAKADELMIRGEN